MRNTAVILALGLLFSLPAAAWRVVARESETIRQSFTLPAGSGPAVLEVDNVDGPLTVGVGDDHRIELSAVVTYEAPSAEALARARREVTLDRGQEGRALRLYVDGPFRERGRRGDARHGEEPRYTVSYAFELAVPRRTDLTLRTVNGGNIRVDGVEGAFAIGNVNGGVVLSGIGGAGSATTVNGPVTVAFAVNPAAPCRFTTINGDLEVTFQPGVDADFRLKTLNGEAYADFPYTFSSRPLPAARRRDGEVRVYTPERAVVARTGDGGPEVAFETINGDILIRRADD